MKLIVGLGNPGKSYINSRHNIGFSIIKALSQLLGVSLKRDSGGLFLSGKGKIRNKNILLAMPLTFMNLSGLAVSALIKKYKIALPRPCLKSDVESKQGRGLDNLLVVCDDLDLALGRLKIRPGGSSGGHRGLESVIEHLGTDEFSRLRIGIGRPGEDIDAAEYVLLQFSASEKMQIKETVTQACACCQSWALQGITKSMNIFNAKMK